MSRSTPTIIRTLGRQSQSTEGNRGPSTWFFFASEEEQALRMITDFFNGKLIRNDNDSQRICSLDNNFLAIEQQTFFCVQGQTLRSGTLHHCDCL